VTGKQIDRLLTIFERFAAVAERWADTEYPKRDGTEEAEVYRVGQQTEPQSKEEYDQLEPQIGRFEKRFRETNPEA
jgi:hypothetical protein